MLGLVVMAWVLEPFDGGLIVVVDGGGRPVTALSTVEIKFKLAQEQCFSCSIIIGPEFGLTGAI